MKSIRFDVFRSCENLKAIYLEDGCEGSLAGSMVPRSAMVGPVLETDMGKRVWKLRELKSVVIPANMKEIRSHWFYGSSVETVEIPAYVRKIGTEAFCCCAQLRQLIFADDSKLEIIGKGCFRESGLEQITVPSLVTELGDSVFCKCTKLAAVTFAGGSKLVRIGDYCFAESSIQSFKFPPLLSKIGFGAF